MADKQNLTDTQVMLIEIKSDLKGIKTDIAWLKRLFGSIIIVTGVLFGVDVTGMV